MFIKFNIFKYVFILIVLGIIGYAIYLAFINSEEQVEIVQNESNSTSTVSNNISIGLTGFDNINPIITENRDIISLSSLYLEPLVSLKSDYELNLCLAKEISKTGDKTYIIKLKDGLLWSDGTLITSQDVEYTINMIKKGESIYFSNVENIGKVESIDNTTIKITLLKEELFFEYNLVFPIISNSQYSKINDFYLSGLTPISSGKYKVEVNTETKNYEFITNENWYNSNEVDLRIKKIQLVTYETSGELYNNFKIGKIDFMHTSNSNIEEYIGTIGYSAIDYKGMELDFLAFNNTDTLLSRLEVRQAISYIIDKQNLSQSVLNEEYYISNYPLDYGCYLYNSGSTSLNENKATTILEEVGWKYVNNRWQIIENGRTTILNLKLSVLSTDELRIKVAENLKMQIEEFGITVTIEKISQSSYEKYLTNKNYQMLLTGVNNGYSPSLEYFIGENNISNYSNKEVSNLINELYTKTDNLNEVYKTLEKIYFEEVPSICLYRNKLTVLCNKELAGDFKPTNYTYYTNIKNWYKN